MRATLLLIHCITAQFLSMAAYAGEVPVITAATATDPLHKYDDAPVTPDADDPAIWVHPTDRLKSLVVRFIKRLRFEIKEPPSCQRKLASRKPA